MPDPNHNKKNFTPIWIAFGFAFIAVVIIYFVFVVAYSENFTQVTAEGFSGFGAFIGGVGGTLFSAIAAGLVYMAYSTQKRELENSVSVLTETQKNQALQSNLAALTPVMEKIERDFNRTLVLWYAENNSLEKASGHLHSGRTLSIRFSHSFENNNTALSEIQPFNLHDHDGPADQLLGLLAGSLCNGQYNGEKRLRFFMTQFVIQVTSAMQIIKDMASTHSPSHFYSSPAILLKEINETLFFIFNLVGKEDEIPGDFYWFNQFTDESEKLDNIINQIIPPEK